VTLVLLAVLALDVAALSYLIYAVRMWPGWSLGTVGRSIAGRSAHFMTR
jgi:hypothetical protein